MWNLRRSSRAFDRKRNQPFPVSYSVLLDIYSNTIRLNRDGEAEIDEYSIRASGVTKVAVASLLGSAPTVFQSLPKCNLGSNRALPVPLVPSPSPSMSFIIQERRSVEYGQFRGRSS